MAKINENFEAENYIDDKVFVCETIIDTSNIKTELPDTKPDINHDEIFITESEMEVYNKIKVEDVSMSDTKCKNGNITGIEDYVQNMNTEILSSEMYNSEINDKVKLEAYNEIKVEDVSISDTKCKNENITGIEEDYVHNMNTEILSSEMCNSDINDKVKLEAYNEIKVENVSISDTKCKNENITGIEDYVHNMNTEIQSSEMCNNETNDKVKLEIYNEIKVEEASISGTKCKNENVTDIENYVHNTNTEIISFEMCNNEVNDKVKLEIYNEIKVEEASISDTKCKNENITGIENYVHNMNTEILPSKMCHSEANDKDKLEVYNKIKVEDVSVSETKCSENINGIEDYVNNMNTDILSSKMCTSEINDKVKLEVKHFAMGDIKIEFNDEQLYCDQCHENYQDYCTKCRMLIHVLDKRATDSMNDKAKGLPMNILEIRELFGCSGVFALKAISEGVKFGPFLGPNAPEYPWKIGGGKFVLSNDLPMSHWMHYINSVRNSSEQNLLVFQHENNLYYRTIREIWEGEELLLYFGEGYEDGLNENIEIDFIPNAEKNIENVYACTFCCFGFSAELYLTKHKSICPEEASKFSPKEIVQCSFCKIYLEKREYLECHVENCRDKSVRYPTSSLLDDGIVKIEDDGVVKIEEDACVSKKRNKQQRQIYQCEQCEYKTAYRGDFKNHALEHYEKKTHRCEICYQRFKRHGTLKLHIFNVHTNPQEKVYHQCFACDFKTYYKWYLKVHVKAKHCAREEKPFKCLECPYRSNYKSCLKEHMNIKHYGKRLQRFRCQECQYKTNNKAHLTDHVNAKHREVKLRRFTCEECKYKTNKKGDLKRHINAKHGVSIKKLYMCSKCDYETNYSNNLKEHMDVKHRVETLPRFKCPHCDLRTNHKVSLRRHINTRHDVNKVKRYQCPECDYRTNECSCLKEHINAMHTKERVKRFKCPDCEYKTNNKCHLKQHINARHSEEKVKRFKCAHCDYKTNYKLRLQDHINSKHSKHKVKRFKCLECEYKSNFKAHVQRHRNTAHVKVKIEPLSLEELAHLRETKEKLKHIKCLECDYKTNYRSNLERHAKSKHSKENPKPFNCSQCSYRTNTAANLTRHISTKHKVK